MASPSIQVHKLGVEFDDSVLFQNINLHVGPGEIVVIIGPSGSGKSVLLKAMGGIFEPSQGQVFIGGQDLYAMNEAQRAVVLRRMGMLFQKNALFDSFTVGENIAFPLREATKVSEQEIQQHVHQFLHDVGLTHAHSLYPSEISGGMQKRLGIARALALSPEIIFYDDPTAGLDPITSRMIIDLILRLQRAQNSTVVAITNDMNRAYQMADRVGMLIDGELIITGTVEETKKHKDPRVHQFITGALSGPLTDQP